MSSIKRISKITNKFVDMCWSVVIITSTHSLTVLACDRVHARACRERLRDESEDLESCVARG
jgi:hypothetical protein